MHMLAYDIMFMTFIFGHVHTPNEVSLQKSVTSTSTSMYSLIKQAYSSLVMSLKTDYISSVLQRYARV